MATGWETEDTADLSRLVTRPNLPPNFERWQLALGPGVKRPTHPSHWAGALVVVEEGRLEVDCRVGGRHVFSAGDLLVLGWLPLVALRNAGDGPVKLVAVRPQGHGLPPGLLRVLCFIRS